MNYRMDIAFNGSKYYGWQRQTNGCITVQEVLENILRRILHDPELNLCGSSRTDTGVHALNLTASFHSENAMEPAALRAAVEKQLPHDIRINSLAYADSSFNAQHSSLGKAYVYAVLPGAYPLFLRGLVWGWHDVENLQRLKEILPLFIGTHDFSSFTGRDMSGENPVRTIYRAEMIGFGNVICFYLSGNGFLYKMVRRIVGTLHQAVAGNLKTEQIHNMLEHPAMPLEDYTAPPDGLFLKKVFYSENEWNEDQLKEPPFIF